MLLLIAMALTDSQQAQHDNVERAIYQRIQADRATISDTWRPGRRLLIDYSKAQSCYVKFHLYRAPNCDAVLAQVEIDLGNVETAQAEGR
jgi:hypothetical protein